MVFKNTENDDFVNGFFDSRFVLAQDFHLKASFSNSDYISSSIDNICRSPLIANPIKDEAYLGLYDRGNIFASYKSRLDVLPKSNRTNYLSINNSIVDLESIKVSKEIELEEYLRLRAQTFEDVEQVLYNEIVLSESDFNDELIVEYRYFQSDGKYSDLLFQEDYIRSLYYRRSLNEEIRKIKIQIKTVQGEVRFLRKLLLKTKYRNKRQVFRENHSFHFKNLDDVHSLILVNNIVN